MAPLWISSGLLYPLLVLLWETTAQEATNPPAVGPPLAPPELTVTDTPPLPANSLNGNTPTNGSAGASSETQTKTTVPHNTTMDILSIMSERDSLHEESERLRKAVIVLAIFFTLAATAIIIGAAWYFLKRRKSAKLESGNRAQKTTSDELKKESRPQKTQSKDSSDVANSDQSTDKTVHQQGKELRKSLSTSASGTSGDYEDQSNSTDNSRPKTPSVAPKTNKVVYANTGADQTQSTDGAELDPQEVYIELDKGTNRDSADAEVSTTSSGSEQRPPKDDVYENFTPEALRNYSTLDTESQYEHHYDKM